MVPYDWNRFKSTLAEVMACCVMAPRHSLWCWPPISEVLSHSPECNFIKSGQATIMYKSDVKCQNTLSCLYQQTAPNSTSLDVSAPHPQQMEVSAPSIADECSHPLKMCYEPLKYKTTLLWRNWGESKITFVFTLVFVSLVWWTNLT